MGGFPRISGKRLLYTVPESKHQPKLTNHRSEEHGGEKTLVRIPERDDPVIMFRDRADRGGSGSKPVMLRREKTSVFLHRGGGAGIIDRQGKVAVLLLRAEPDKRVAAGIFPAGIQGIFEKIPEDRISSPHRHNS